MKRKAVDRVDDDRYAGQFSGESSQESSLGIMCVNDMVRIVFQEEGHMGKGQEVLQWVEGLHQGLEGPDPHVRISNQVDQWAAGRT